MPKTQDADTVKQLYMADHEWMTGKEEYQDRIDEVFGLIDKAYEEKDVLFIGESYEGETYIITTRNTLIETLTSFDTK